jgi:hypothetical protein
LADSPPSTIQVDAMTQALLRWNMVPKEVVVYYNQPYQISPI